MSGQNSALRAYMAGLAEVGRAVESIAALSKTAQASRLEDVTTPLVDRVKALIRAVPIEAQTAGLPLEYFRTRLRGRRSRYARADDVAAALRAHGWRRKRDWSSKAPSHAARWYPPSNSTAPQI